MTLSNLLNHLVYGSIHHRESELYKNTIMSRVPGVVMGQMSEHSYNNRKEKFKEMVNYELDRIIKRLLCILLTRPYTVSTTSSFRHM